MKKLLSIILIFAMSISLGGCGAKEPESTIVQLTAENIKDYYNITVEWEPDYYVHINPKFDFKMLSPITIVFDSTPCHNGENVYCDYNHANDWVFTLSAGVENKFYLNQGSCNVSLNWNNNLIIIDATGKIELPAGSAIETTSQS